MKSNFLIEASERGFIADCTEGLDDHFVNQVTAYVGFDCTADSLHVGSLIQIMLMRLLRKHGHHPIALYGDATTRIGDPTGRDTSRPVLTKEQIFTNSVGINACIDQILSDKTTILNNLLWFKNIKFIDLLTEIGPHLSINRMLTMDSVKSRLDRQQPMTFLEFNYLVMQAYDFVELNRRHGVTVQFGGSDQWGNIVAGIDLIRRINGNTAFGLTTPLLETSSGQKMGKTASGAVWLSENKTNVFDFWQFWRNTEDGDVERFLKLFTDLSLDQITTIMTGNINEAKKILATEVTTIVHGMDKAVQAEKTAAQAFETGGVPDDLPGIDVPLADLKIGIAAIKLFEMTGLTPTFSAARRLVRDGGAKINGVALNDERRIVTDSDLANGVIKLSSGRKNHRLVKAR